jgi:hypothetical protein
VTRSECEHSDGNTKGARVRPDSRSRSLRIMQRGVGSLVFGSRIATSLHAQLDPTQIFDVRAVIQFRSMARARVSNQKPDGSAMLGPERSASQLVDDDTFTSYRLKRNGNMKIVARGVQGQVVGLLARANKTQDRFERDSIALTLGMESGYILDAAIIIHALEVVEREVGRVLDGAIDPEEAGLTHENVSAYWWAANPELTCRSVLRLRFRLVSRRQRFPQA